jgi:feruloyl-CoA synthase
MMKLKMAAMQMLAAETSDVAPLERLAARVKAGIEAHNSAAGGSSRRVARFSILTAPPSIDAGEITDKGYVNQRATQDSRAAEVASLFTAEAGPGVVQL